MRTTAVLVIIALCMPFAALSQGIQIESGAEISDSVSRDLAIKLAQYIVISGYSCSSVSAVTPFAFSRGYHVVSNNWQYSYEVADKGGRLVATVN